MKTIITYSEAKEIFDKYLKTEYLRFHCRETEVIMRALARHLGHDEDFWGITGLLHDLDLDEIGENMQMHGRKTVELLKDEGYDIPELFDAILSHVEGIKGVPYKRETDFQFILAGAENITGLISAYVILRPDKKIEGVKVKSIMKKFKSPAFAAKVSREFILEAAEHAKMELNEFIGISIEAMASIADEIGM
ncbi:MAG: HD domain-containing protein [Candidatus Marinimicrobia bacterium]|nr:HD domain-containing protein [Candidatus Neomarinimicrobiota bacterium]